MCIICPTRSSRIPLPRSPRIIISDERDQVLGTGGAVVKALPLLGNEPFFHVNADTMWIDGVRRIWPGWPKPSIQNGWISCC
jgi:hypothetical protein